MHFFIKTKGRSSLVEMYINNYGNIIAVIGVDKNREKNQYFNMLIENPGKYQFQLPDSPGVLKIYVFDTSEGDKDKSDRFKIERLTFSHGRFTPKLIIDQDTKEFINFARKFAKNADILKEGTYTSKNGKFKINYSWLIEDDEDTPSRINSLNDEIDVSKKWFLDLTVPGRNAILLHEFSHNFKDDPLDQTTENLEIEKKADANALEIYKAIGYPSFEWMYSWLSIFDDVDDHYDRLDAGDNQLQQEYS